MGSKGSKTGGHGRETGSSDRIEVDFEAILASLEDVAPDREGWFTSTEFAEACDPPTSQTTANARLRKLMKAGKLEAARRKDLNIVGDVISKIMYRAI